MSTKWALTTTYIALMTQGVKPLKKRGRPPSAQSSYRQETAKNEIVRERERERERELGSTAEGWLGEQMLGEEMCEMMSKNKSVEV